MTKREKRVLRVIEEEGVIAGAALRLRTEIRYLPALIGVVRKLEDRGLIGSSGPLDPPKSVLSAYFSVVPSARGAIRSILND